MRWWLMLVCLALLSAGCSKTEQERASRLAVKRVLAAPQAKLADEMRHIVAMGSYVLPDVVQEYHTAPPIGRLRLLDVLRRIGDPEAV